MKGHAKRLPAGPYLFIPNGHVMSDSMFCMAQDNGRGNFIRFFSMRGAQLNEMQIPANIAKGYGFFVPLSPQWMTQQ